MEPEVRPRQATTHRSRANLFVEFSDAKFKRIFQFTKEGAMTICNMMWNQLQFTSLRNNPLSVEQQVPSYKIIYTYNKHSWCLGRSYLELLLTMIYCNMGCDDVRHSLKCG